MTAFIVAMDAPGVEVRPIRQMSGGASFNEVSSPTCASPIDSAWETSAQVEGRAHDTRVRTGRPTAVGVGGSWSQVRDLARWLERSDDPLVRQALAELYAGRRITELVWQRASIASKGGAPGPQASIGKLRWTNHLTR